MYNPTFIGDIDLNEDTLTHYGVKGMKWRRRKGKKKNTKTKTKDDFRRIYNQTKSLYDQTPLAIGVRDRSHKDTYLVQTPSGQGRRSVRENNNDPHGNLDTMERALRKKRKR